MCYVHRQEINTTKTDLYYSKRNSFFLDVLFDIFLWFQHIQCILRLVAVSDC